MSFESLFGLTMPTLIIQDRPAASPMDRMLKPTVTAREPALVINLDVRIAFLSEGPAWPISMMTRSEQYKAVESGSQMCDHKTRPHARTIATLPETHSREMPQSHLEGLRMLQLCL